MPGGILGFQEWILVDPGLPGVGAGLPGVDRGVSGVDPGGVDPGLQLGNT